MIFLTIFTNLFFKESFVAQQKQRRRPLFTFTLKLEPACFWGRLLDDIFAKQYITLSRYSPFKICHLFICGQVPWTLQPGFSLGRGQLLRVAKVFIFIFFRYLACMS